MQKPTRITAIIIMMTRWRCAAWVCLWKFDTVAVNPSEPTGMNSMLEFTRASFASTVALARKVTVLCIPASIAWTDL